MIKRAFILLCYLWPSPVFATVGYPIVNFSEDSPAVAATEYAGIMGNAQLTNGWDTTEGNIYQIIPATGTLSRMYVEVDTAPNNGVGTQSFVFTFRSGTTSANIADSAMTCTISEGAIACSYQGAGIAITAGDRVDISSVPANTPTAPGRIRIVLFWEPTTAGQYFFACGNNTTVATDVNSYFHAVGDCIRDATEADKYGIIGKAAVVKNLYIEHGTAPGGATSYLWTIRDCGAYTAPLCAGSVVTCAVSGTGTTCSDTANSFTIDAEDIMTLETDPSASAPLAPGTVHVGFVLQMSNPLTWVTAVTSQTALDVAATQYIAIHTEEDANDGTVADHESLMLETDLTGIWVRLGADPGTSPDAYSFTVQQNQADTPCTVTITADNTTGESTACSVRYSVGDNANIEISPLNTPATAVTRTQIGLAWAYRPRRKVLVE